MSRVALVVNHMWRQITLKEGAELQGLAALAIISHYRE